MIKIVEGMIWKMKENRAAGVDGINSTFIKKCCKGLVRPLREIFRESMRVGEIPDAWKLANVVAIFKKGARWDPGNYRPVSLTSQIGKIMEGIIKENLVDYLEGNGLFGKSQHGFRKNRSCLTNLLEFMEVVSNRLDKKEWVDVIYLDFKKAFDSVPHVRLLRKLEALGVRGEILRWIREWLRNRKQRVTLEGVESEWENVISGVPQGSVLGPVLFAIYIEDIDEGVCSRMLKFADDTKVIGKSVTEEDVRVLREDLERLREWSEKWQMGFNVDKCKVMYMGKGNSKAEYKLGNKVLEECNEEKDLGVVISRNGKVEKQCAEAAKKGFKVLGMIARTFVTRKRNVILQLYKSLVRPLLDYCVQAWRPYRKKDIDLLERVQKRATRMVEECKELDYEERLRRLGLTTLETRRLRADLVEVYKILIGEEGVRRGDFFIGMTGKEGLVGGGRGGMRLRGNKWRLHKKRFRIDCAKYSFGNRVIKWWNKIPDSVIEGVGGIGGYKGRLDKLMRWDWGLK